MTEVKIGEYMFREVRTLEQGQSYILEIVGQVERARVVCDDMHRCADVLQDFSREALEKAYRSLSIRYGQALGSLVTLMHCRVLTDQAYNELRGRIELAMMPKVVATVQP